MRRPNRTTPQLSVKVVNPVGVVHLGNVCTVRGAASKFQAALSKLAPSATWDVAVWRLASKVKEEVVEASREGAMS